MAVVVISVAAVCNYLSEEVCVSVAPNYSVCHTQKKIRQINTRQ